MKISKLEQGFYLGVGFHYLATRRCGLLKALNQAMKDIQEAKQREDARIVDPHNRTVES